MCIFHPDFLRKPTLCVNLHADNQVNRTLQQHENPRLTTSDFISGADIRFKY